MNRRGPTVGQSWTPRRRQQLIEDILRQLPPQGEAPVSTNHLGARLGLDQYDRSVVLWRILDRLATLGQVERTNPGEHASRFWRLTDAGRALRDNPPTGDA